MTKPAIARTPDMPRTPNFVTQPVIEVDATALVGAESWRAMAELAAARGTKVVAVDCYPGSDVASLRTRIAEALPSWRIVESETAALPIEQIDAMIVDNLTDDRVFGVMAHRDLATFYDPAALAALREDVAAGMPTVVLGWGAFLAAPEGAVLALVDMARWEIQQRYRAGMANWRCDNGDTDVLRKYKRGFFVEWRMADRHKHAHFDTLDFVVDGNTDADVTLRGDDVRRGLDVVVARPFRLVPYFDQGVWGGQWMKEVLGLEQDATNYAWCFDCVPEENSIVLACRDGVTMELPAMNVVQERPMALMGERTVARFGSEFPIRFDFLDTMSGANLSLQVHPLTDYIQREFGMHYTQDESYYLLDATEDAVVYLGLRDDADPAELESALRTAADGGDSFPAERFVNVFPAQRHDHFLIPAGTIHCSGADAMVLEISATPYIFTFKMWDWDRLGLDGRPRPIHLDHALANVQWDRRTEFAQTQLCNQIRLVAEGEGWREESTGLHDLEFIETRRTWARVPVAHNTRGTVNVVNLVHGEAAVVSSSTDAFEPYEVHYAETFVVPAAVGEYIISPAEGVAEIATLKAYVRGTFAESR